MKLYHRHLVEQSSACTVSFLLTTTIQSQVFPIMLGIHFQFIRFVFGLKEGI